METSFARKMMRWHQPTGPPEPLNYWSREIKCSLVHSFYKYNHLYSQVEIIFWCILYCRLYCRLYCTLYCILYCICYCVLYCILFCQLYKIMYCVYLTVYWSTVSSILCMLVIERQNKLFSNLLQCWRWWATDVGDQIYKT